jgi:hypothetical protein
VSASDAVRVTDLRFSEAPEAATRTGLLGWVRFTLNDLVVIDGATLRRTRDNRLTLSFPVRYDARGAQFFAVRPLNSAARFAIEEQVFSALGIKAEERAP